MIDSVHGHQGKQGACSGKWVFQGADGGAEREKVEAGKDGEAEEKFSLTLVFPSLLIELLCDCE